MNALLLICLIYIHQWPSIQLGLASTWSLTNIYPHAIFHDRVEQFYDATWLGMNSDWMSQLLYEWQKFVNNTYPFLFSNPWLSYIFQQSWKVSNNIAIVTYPWICIYYHPIHIWDHCKWSQDIPSYIIQTLFLNQWHSSIFMSYISSYNKYIVFSH